MMKRKAFTLIELLVVISIIALLLSIMMPSLQMVKEKARGLLCQTNLKQFNLANEIYASEYDGYSVWTWQWYTNGPFMEMLGHSDEEVEFNLNPTPNFWWLKFNDDLICPDSFVRKKGIVENPDTGFPYSLGTTYGINCGMLNMAQFKKDNVKSPSQKIFFTDSSDYVINEVNNPYTDASISGINYKIHWDVAGDLYDPYGTDRHYTPSGFQRHGVVTYRHSEGASLIFFDGHTELRKKEKIFVLDDSGSSDNGAMRSLWDLR